MGTYPLAAPQEAGTAAALGVGTVVVPLSNPDHDPDHIVYVWRAVIVAEAYDGGGCCFVVVVVAVAGVVVGGLRIVLRLLRSLRVGIGLWNGHRLEQVLREV